MVWKEIVILTVPVMPSATVYCCGVNANPSCGPAGVVGLSEKGASIKIELSKHGEWSKAIVSNIAA